MAAKEYTQEDIILAIQLSQQQNNGKQYKKTIKKLNPILSSTNISNEQQQIQILQLLLEAYIELENLEDETFYQVLTTLMQLDPKSALSSNEKFFIFGQLLGGESGIKSYQQGIENIKTKKEITQDDKSKMISGYLSMCEIYMTDLCMLPEAEGQCENFLNECLKIDENSANVWLQYGSFKISQQKFNDSLQCFEKAWSLFTAKVNSSEESDSLNDLQFCYNLIKFLMELGQLDLSLEILNESKKYEDDNIEGLYLEGFLNYLYLKIKNFNINQSLDINNKYTPDQFMNNDLNATILETPVNLNNESLNENVVDAKIAFSYLLLLAENMNEIDEMVQEYIEGSDNILANELGGAIDRQELISLKKGDFIKDADEVDLDNENFINN
ncbi:hypothetical protein HANVADRAFT_47164 [Hanseniaspora valbyensis NRRL Y-1626]|uniref:TPR-like protein n=1 Tax=Hanseniaspora valbyensis NRRL Y-1626 TaxID=766949 RepID=A0A1B7T7R6_9ASCO|nr:hypothetical protein HANVADRAFT_4424 [Hanseniaspora valbyensis NRRL Y-1626]OBA28483.1 hypothetical protein HANVADRAFT_47164 [Hanseniaspora valbyensis NRRL Y-1626]